MTAALCTSHPVIPNPISLDDGKATRLPHAPTSGSFRRPTGVLTVLLFGAPTPDSFVSFCPASPGLQTRSNAWVYGLLYPQEENESADGNVVVVSTWLREKVPFIGPSLQRENPCEKESHQNRRGRLQHSKISGTRSSRPVHLGWNLLHPPRRCLASNKPVQNNLTINVQKERRHGGTTYLFLYAFILVVTPVALCPRTCPLVSLRSFASAVGAILKLCVSISGILAWRLAIASFVLPAAATGALRRRWGCSSSDSA